MSYARLGWDGSDVYVYLDIYGFVSCCGCAFGGSKHFDSTDAILAHLAEHKAAGHHVTDETVAEIEDDRERIDSYIAGCAEGRAASSGGGAGQ